METDGMISPSSINFAISAVTAVQQSKQFPQVKMLHEAGNALLNLLVLSPTA